MEKEKAKAAGRRPYGIEDYNAEERDIYRLERLWGDAPVVLLIA